MGVDCPKYTRMCLLEDETAATLNLKFKTQPGNSDPGEGPLSNAKTGLL